MKLEHTPVRPPGDLASEKVFFRQWIELMSSETESDLGSPLEKILRHYCAKVEQREATVASSFICWLGTMSGASYLNVAQRATEVFLPEEAYLAAWATHNRRRYATNNGWRSLELQLQSQADHLSNTLHTPSANDYEVAEHVAAWLGTDAGQRFLGKCETEVMRRQKLDTIALYCKHGKEDAPIVEVLRTELAKAPFV